jgi:ABC-type glycerol-3-phosphate transport system substrate-binding protein
MRKYLISIELLILSAFSVLVGCQLQNVLSLTSAGLTTPTVSATSEPSILPEDTATPVPSASPVTLTIWLPPQLDPENGTPAGNLLKERLTGFQAEHPQFVVEIRIKALEGQGGLLETLTTTSAAAPAALPAIIALPYPQMASAASSGLLQPVTDGVNFGDADWLPYATTMATTNDMTYGVPFGGDALVLAYRSLLSPTPPATWQDLASQEQIVSFPASDPDAAVFSQIYLAAGGAFTDENGNPVLQEEPLKETFEVINLAAQHNVFPYWTADFMSFDESWGAFLNQQADYSLIWTSQYLQERPEGITITTLPRMGEETTTLMEGWLWCLPSLSSAEKQNSLLLMEYLSDPEFVNEWSLTAGYLPVRESGFENWNDQPETLLINQIVTQDQLLPFKPSDEITTSLLQDAGVKIIKKQVYYQKLLNEILDKFQVK